MCRKPGSVMCATDRASNETRLHSPQHRNRRTYRPCTTRDDAKDGLEEDLLSSPAPCSQPFASLTPFARKARQPGASLILHIVMCIGNARPDMQVSGWLGDRVLWGRD